MTLSPHDLLTGRWSWSPLPAGSPAERALQLLHDGAVDCGRALAECHGLAVIDVALRCRRRLLDHVEHVGGALGDAPSAELRELLAAVVEVAVSLPRLGRAALSSSNRPAARALPSLPSPRRPTAAAAAPKD